MGIKSIEFDDVSVAGKFTVHGDWSVCADGRLTLHGVKSYEDLELVLSLLLSKAVEGQKPILAALQKEANQAKIPAPTVNLHVVQADERPAMSHSAEHSRVVAEQAALIADAVKKAAEKKAKDAEAAGVPVPARVVMPATIEGPVVIAMDSPKADAVSVDVSIAPTVNVSVPIHIDRIQFGPDDLTLLGRASKVAHVIEFAQSKGAKTFEEIAGMVQQLKDAAVCPILMRVADLPSRLKSSCAAAGIPGAI